MNKIEKHTQDDMQIESLSFELLQGIINEYKEKKGSYDYIILTTRRCFCLFYSINKNSNIQKQHKLWFLKNSKYLKEVEQKIISSQKVDMIGKQFKDCSVLLVDDIMIHGQTMFNYFERITNFGAKNIDTLVLIRNVEFPDYYFLKTNKEYFKIHQKVNWDWRILSNNIVSYLHNQGQLYVSYVYGFNVDESTLKEVINSENLECCKVDFSNHIKHKLYVENCQPKYYFIPKYSKYSFIEQAFLRVYPIYNNSSKEYRIIPYIELSRFKCENLQEIWNKIWIGDKPEELKAINTVEDIYKFLTAFLSIILCKTLFSKEKLSIETPEIDKSLVDGLYEIVEKHVSQEVLEIIEKEYQNLEVAINAPQFYNNRIGKISFDTISSNFDAIEKIKQYFYSVSNEEESNFNKMVSNILENPNDSSNNVTSVSIDATNLYKLIPEQFKKECLGFLFYLLDSGVASHVVRTFGIGKDKYVSTSIKAGEQSYHLFSDLSGSAIRPIYFLLTRLEKFDDLDEVQKIKNTFIKKLKEIDIQNINSIEYVLTNPPVNLKADYFGIIKHRNNALTQMERNEEQHIIEILKEIFCDNNKTVGMSD